MLDYLRSLPFGVWAGAVILGLGLWTRDILGVVLGGIVAVITLIASDRAAGAEPEEDADDISKDERFKDL